jgi:two-component system chemotaxis response regulator CheY
LHWQIRGLGAESPVFGALRQKGALLGKKYTHVPYRFLWYGLKGFLKMGILCFETISIERRQAFMKVKSDFPGVGEASVDGQKPDGAPYRVLIVDDSIFVAKQLSQILTSVGFEIAATAGDGEAGLEKYKELFPNVDVVTMDITMPKMDGITALEKIIEFDKNANVIMVSALGKNDLVKKALLTGAKNYIIKPLDRKKVLERIVTSLNK